jgi:6-phosphogluconolactonase
MSVQPDIWVAKSGQDWVSQASRLILQVSEAAIQAQGRCLLALSGGSTPKTLYQAWTNPDWSQRFDWSRTVFLFGDERCVPPNHAESNYGMAQAALFHPLGIQPEAIIRMEGEHPDPITAARDYETRVRALTGCPEPDFPRLDLILLGLGDDGHTASLFPGTAALEDRIHAVTVGHAPKGIALRLTLTLGVINRATMVVFLVTGSSKAPIVQAVLEPRTSVEQGLPAAMVKPRSGRLVWMLDQAAAAQLNGMNQGTGFTRNA